MYLSEIDSMITKVRFGTTTDFLLVTIFAAMSSKTTKFTTSSRDEKETFFFVCPRQLFLKISFEHLKQI